MNEHREIRRIGRRAFLGRGGALVLAATAGGASRGVEGAEAEALRIGLVTDLHYGDKEPTATRFYREAPAKLAEAVAGFQKFKPDFVVEIGDLIDSGDSVETELRWVETIDAEFAKSAGDRHYVLGNHCVETLTKAEFLGAVGKERSFYSFDRGGFHFVVLDACFRSDGQPYGRKNSRWTDANVPTDQVEWLKADLAAGKAKTIVLVHQRLDVGGDYGIKNAEEIRRALEDSRRVLAVFQGHYHRGDHRELGGIHYATFRAMIEGSGPENSGYSEVSIRPDGSIVINGFRRQPSYRWSWPS